MAAIRVDISQDRYSVGSEPKPKTDMQGRQRTDRVTGIGLSTTQLVKIGPEGAEVLNCVTAGVPEVKVGDEVRPRNLIAIPWQQEGRSGVSFKADAIEPIPAAAGKGGAA